MSKFENKLLLLIWFSLVNHLNWIIEVTSLTQSEQFQCKWLKLTSQAMVWCISDVAESTTTVVTYTYSIFKCLITIIARDNLVVSGYKDMSYQLNYTVADYNCLINSLNISSCITLFVNIDYWSMFYLAILLSFFNDPQSLMTHSSLILVCVCVCVCVWPEQWKDTTEMWHVWN